jgi:hypothetical protein
MSMASVGGDGSSIIPMKSLSAFMYAPLRMLPASLIAEHSSSPSALELPTGRPQHQLRQSQHRALGEHEQRAAREVAEHRHEHGGHRLLVVAELRRKVLQPHDVDGRHVIMIVQPVICDSAVAAWPPDVRHLASASSCSPVSV